MEDDLKLDLDIPQRQIPNFALWDAISHFRKFATQSDQVYSHQIRQIGEDSELLDHLIIHEKN